MLSVSPIPEIFEYHRNPTEGSSRYSGHGQRKRDKSSQRNETLVRLWGDQCVIFQLHVVIGH